MGEDRARRMREWLLPEGQPMVRQEFGRLYFFDTVARTGDLIYKNTSDAGLVSHVLVVREKEV